MICDRRGFVFQIHRIACFKGYNIAHRKHRHFISDNEFKCIYIYGSSSRSSNGKLPWKYGSRVRRGNITTDTPCGGRITALVLSSSIRSFNRTVSTITTGTRNGDRSSGDTGRSTSSATTSAATATVVKRHTRESCTNGITGPCVSMGRPIECIGEIPNRFTHRTKSGCCRGNRSRNHAAQIPCEVTRSTSRTPASSSSAPRRCRYRVAGTACSTDSRSVTGPSIVRSIPGYYRSKPSDGLSSRTKPCSTRCYSRSLCSDCGARRTRTAPRRCHCCTCRTTSRTYLSVLSSEITGLTRIYYSISAPRTEKYITLFLYHLGSWSIVLRTG